MSDFETDRETNMRHEIQRKSQLQTGEGGYSADEQAQ